MKGSGLLKPSYVAKAALALVAFVVIFSLGGCAKPSVQEPAVEEPRPMYWSSRTCSLCHFGIFEQQRDSMHEQSFNNPVFRAQYFQEVLPSAKSDAVFLDDATGCIRCHSPVTAYQQEGPVTVEQGSENLPGVTCDFCHTITGFKGTDPGGGDYISEPNETKHGPFRCQTEWHHKYSDFHGRSEFCAICHEDTNRHGLRVKATYTEWRQSDFPRQGIHCQDCHMNEVGFLTGGRPLFESGHAAEIDYKRTPYRAQLYTHRFPGAHSQQQVIGAITLEVQTQKPAGSPGDFIDIDVYVNNSRTGHKMPTGSADLRVMWLELKAYTNRGILPIKAPSAQEGKLNYDVSGDGMFDAEMLDDSVPKGNRIYRAVYVDPSWKQTFSFYDAMDIIFDNRLNAGEVRKETYRFIIPHESAGSTISIQAVLNYLPYPYPFAERLGLPDPSPVVIAYGKARIEVQ